MIRNLQNNLILKTIIVFCYEDETPYIYRIYTSKQTFEEHVDLLLLANSKHSHYVLINSLVLINKFD